MSDAGRLMSRVRGQIALGAALEDLQRGIAVGASLALGAFVLRAFGAVQFDPLLAVIGGAAVAVTVPLAGLVVRRRTKARIAAEADRALGLEERLSTALWCETSAAGRSDPLGPLVQLDAEGVAKSVDARTVRQAFRPRFLRRQAWIAGAALAACALVSLYQPIAEATETKQDKAARLSQEERNAKVARKLKEQAKKLAEAAKERKLVSLEKTARHVRKQAQELLSRPPDRQKMLAKINELRDTVKADARRLAGTPKDMESQKADEASKALSKLLQNMANVGLESLQKDLAELAERLKAGEQGSSPPSLQEIKSMAARVDALRKALANADKTGMGKELREQLASLANQDLLDEISKKMREIQQRMQQGQAYQQLESEQASEWSDMSQMSREELQALLDQLEQMAAMEDLERLLQQAGQEAAGGGKMRLGGSGGT